MFSPVDVKLKSFVPKIAMPNSPDPGLYTPVEVSDAKLSEGAPAVPSTKDTFTAPAAIVEAFSKLT